MREKEQNTFDAVFALENDRENEKDRSCSQKKAIFIFHDELFFFFFLSFAKAVKSMLMSNLNEGGTSLPRPRMILAAQETLNDGLKFFLFCF